MKMVWGSTVHSSGCSRGPTNRGQPSSFISSSGWKTAAAAHNNERPPADLLSRFVHVSSAPTKGRNPPSFHFALSAECAERMQLSRMNNGCSVVGRKNRGRRTSKRIREKGLIGKLFDSSARYFKLSKDTKLRSREKENCETAAPPPSPPRKRGSPPNLPDSLNRKSIRQWGGKSVNTPILFPVPPCRPHNGEEIYFPPTRICDKSENEPPSCFHTVSPRFRYPADTHFRNEKR